MKKVVLIRPSYSVNIYKVYEDLPKNREIRPPLGLMYIAAALEKDGHKVIIIDAEINCLTSNQAVDKALKYRPDFIGITATTPEFESLCNMAHRIRELDPAVVVVAGGSHVSSLPDASITACPEIDYVAVGEGEKTMVSIVRGEPSPGERVVRAFPMQNLDENVLPARHLVDYSKYQYPIPGKGLVRMDAIESSRGCPFSCTFCCKRNTKHRLRSPELVVDEIEDSHKKYDTKFFMFFDDTFTVYKEFVLEVCDEIVKRGLNKKVSFYVNTRANTTDKEMLVNMKKAGLTEISMGVETGSERILRASKKGTRKEQYRRIYNWMSELGLQTRGSFIIGFPWEDHETIWDTINFAKELNLMRATCNIMTPYPGTKVYKQAIEKDGISFETDDWSSFKRWGNSAIRTNDLTKNDLEHYQKLFLTLFYSQPKVILYHLKQVLKGNFSYYFYRPMIFGVRNRIKLLLGKKI
jgi:radical SAM superfamily enzyme YgiQ (UPF0313 family)